MIHRVNILVSINFIIYILDKSELDIIRVSCPSNCISAIGQVTKFITFFYSQSS